jgi:hypothetical protein
MPPGRAGALYPWEIAQGNENAYPIKHSVRLRSGASMSRTPTAAGSQTKFTLSWWGRRNTLNYAGGGLFLGNIYGQQYASFNLFTFQGTRFVIQAGQYGVSTDYTYYTDFVFKNTSRFHHFQIAVDTTQSNASRRFLFYYDNVIIGFDGMFGINTPISYINNTYNNTFFGSDMEIAEAHLVDGQQLPTSAFQSADGRNIPVKYTGTYGTNGWRMEFADTSALTNGSNVGIGKDTSGNGKFLNTTGISITSGANYDAFKDSPVDVSASVSTFATLDPYNPNATTLTNGNLTASGATDLPTIIPTKGNWYFEISGVAKTWTPPAAFPSAAGDYNFGQRPFTNAVPAGYATLNSFNAQMLGT